jgi:uncharacterized protein YkwD
MKITIKTIILTLVTVVAMNGCGSNNGGGCDDYGCFEQNHPFEAPAVSESDKQAFLNAINNARATGRTCGDELSPAAGPVTWVDGLYLAAYEHNVDMKEAGYIGHYGSNTASDWTSQVQNLGYGSTWVDRARNNGADSSLAYSENTASGWNSLSRVVNGWLNSPRHCTNLMNLKHTTFGMARVGEHWTQLFGH